MYIMGQCIKPVCFPTAIGNRPVTQLYLYYGGSLFYFAGSITELHASHRSNPIYWGGFSGWNDECVA